MAGLTEPEAASTSTQHVSTQYSSNSLEGPAKFTIFFKLPPELRILIYEKHFSDKDAVVAPKLHPRSQNATALLLASRQLHEEARPVLHRCATLTLDLDPALQQHTKDIAYFLDHQLEPGYHLPGHISELASFRHIHLTLDSAPPRGTFARPFQTARGKRVLVYDTRWWQHISSLIWMSILFINKHRVPDLTLTINLGNVTRVPANSSRESLSRLLTLPRFQSVSWRGLSQRSTIPWEETTEQRTAKKRGVAFSRMKTEEGDCLAHVHYCVDRKRQ